jgi:hypothetical protein
MVSLTSVSKSILSSRILIGCVPFIRIGSVTDGDVGPKQKHFPSGFSFAALDEQLTHPPQKPVAKLKIPFGQNMYRIFSLYMRIVVYYVMPFHTLFRY